MARAGQSSYARTPGELVEALDRLKDEAVREAGARAGALFDAVPAERVIRSVLG
jgi:hypothetical protein